jgi:hypothetical protein
LASLNTARNKAKISAVKSEMSEFVKAIELYKEKTGAYHNCAPCHYTYDEGDVTDTTNFTTAFVQTFQDHKVFNGDITKTLLKAPDVTYYNIYYEGLPSGLATISSTYDCGNQTTFSDYYIRFIVYPNIDLSGSYWSTETEDGEPTGYYCAGH